MILIGISGGQLGVRLGDRDGDGFGSVVLVLVLSYGNSICWGDRSGNHKVYWEIGSLIDQGSSGISACWDISWELNWKIVLRK